MKLFGWKPDDPFTEKLIASLPTPHVPTRLIRQSTKRDVLLWDAMKVVQPNWKRQAQGIGDCVSWGAELGCTCLLWNMAAKGEIEFIAEAATEAIYGGCRVEVHGGPQMGLNEDGAAGSWAADWLRQYGVLLRIDYSKLTGVAEHDLRVYKSDRAQKWGYYGCGGQTDKGLLDNVAKQYPVKDITAVLNSTEAEAAIDAGCPITVASSAGFEGQRDSEGIIHKNGSWPHQMVILGKKYTAGGNLLFRLFNSWNGSADGPDPGIDSEAVSACSWWITPKDADKIFREQDSFALSSVTGFTQAPYDFNSDLLV